MVESNDFECDEIPTTVEMTNSPKNAANNAGMAAKKRKRKRGGPKKDVGSLEQHVEQHVEQPMEESVHETKIRSNKKIKFDEEAKIEKLAREEKRPTETESKTESRLESRLESRPQVVNTDQNEITNRDEPKKQSAKATKSKEKKKKVTYYSDDSDDEGTFHQASVSSRGELAAKAQQLLETRKQLPIYQHKDKILEYVARNQVTVVIGETGSGKSTQIPQFLMPVNKKQIAVTQPRRVAAASLAARVSQEYGCALGHEVGYQVRFANLTHPQRTKLKYLTDGMLLREMMLDSSLSKYTTIILDEAHERTVLTDLIMGFLKQLLVSKKRTDLKVIVMSATLNAELFSAFFDHAPILFIEGKIYPVSHYYLEDDTEDIADTMVKTVVQLNRSEGEGDILCFLPGQEEIDTCVNILEQLAPQLPKDSPLIVPMPLYAQLSPGQQARIFESLPKRRRKVILATNIAETSITVPGVKYVVDSGLRKVKVWKHQLGLSTLLTTPISQASAQQRAGRAGRESAGKSFRLYSEKTLTTSFPKQQEPEIVRNDIVLPVLTLKKLGVDDLLNWAWLEHPGNDAILSALSTLYALGALNDAGTITSLGYKMSVLPLPPQLSVVLLTAAEFGVLAPVIDIVACLSVDNLVLNVGGQGDSRDEVNYARRQYSPLGCKHGDLIAFKEYFDYFRSLPDAECKAWCKDMHFNYKGFKNVLKVRRQLREYMVATARQDDSATQHERETQLRQIRTQLDDSNGDDSDDDEATTEHVSSALDIPAVLKSFLKGYITNTAVGMPDRSYRTFTSGQLISIHPSSHLFGKSNLDCIMYIEYVYTSKGYGRNCSVMELAWLQEIAPHILGAAKINVHG